MSILVIAEKPSVAKSIADVLGATDRHDGYMEGGGYIVSWCIGHLVGLADASAYGDFAKWRLEDLPILPGKWITRVAPDKQKQFEILKSLMERTDVTSLVCATDAGREGELIFRFVYKQAGCTKPFKRLWISSMEESSIRAGFDNLKDGSKYDDLYHSALARAYADWIVGINATRLYSTLYGKTLSVGRVQSPTLALLTERSAKISGFMSEKYHHVNLELDGVISASSERIPAADEAEKIRAACDGKQALCVAAIKEEKSLSAPKLFDLTALQREANNLFGYTAKQTLDLAQSLYEKRLFTYPRTDSRFLTTDMQTGLSALIDSAAILIGARAGSASVAQVIDDKKVSDHHAIIPTEGIAKTDVSVLSDAERNILLLVCARLVCAVDEKHVFEAVAYTFDCGDTSFIAKGKTVITAGWKQIEVKFKSALKLKVNDADSSDNEGRETFPSISEGQVFEGAAATVTEHFTQPPKPYTEATLLSAMEVAGAKDTANEAERKGLGTSATRAAVIENLVGRKFVERRGKQLIPTKDGEALVSALPDALRSPVLTAEWENILTLIAKGEALPEDFLSDIKEMTTTIVKDSTKDEALACMFSPGKEIVGTCPRCGESVFEGKKNFYCKNRECAFVMWKSDRFFESRKTELTKAIAAALLKDGKAQVKGLYSEKSGKTYDAVILLADTGEKYVNYRFEKRE